jgi:hypothetical protein
MANRGAVNQTLPVGSSYTIPAGYHNGSGKVTNGVTNKGTLVLGETNGTSVDIADGYYTHVNTTALYNKAYTAGNTANLGSRETISKVDDGDNKTYTVVLKKDYRVVAAGAAHEGTGAGSDVTYSGKGSVTYCAGMYTWEKNITIVNAKAGDIITLQAMWYAVYGWV